jgi:hypothetical protein
MGWNVCVGKASAVGLFNIIALWDGFGFEGGSAGQYHKKRLCYLAWGWFYWRTFCLCGGFALCLFQAMCKKWVGTKSMTVKPAEGLAVGWVVLRLFV